MQLERLDDDRPMGAVLLLRVSLDRRPQLGLEPEHHRFRSIDLQELVACDHGLALQAVVLTENGTDDLRHRARAGLLLDPLPDVSGDGLEQIRRPVSKDAHEQRSQSMCRRVYHYSQQASSSLLMEITLVVRKRPKPKVSWVYARFVVTTVKDEHPLGDGANTEFISHPMRLQWPLAPACR
jgi:hypothetical protein